MKRKVRVIQPPKRRRALGEINVTPLIDVVLVLLIIFMVVTPLLEKQLVVQTPATEAIESDEVPEQLVVSLDSAGGLKLNDDPVLEAELADTLRARLTGAKEKVVFFKADDAAPYAALARALGQGRAAGATLGFAVEDDAATAGSGTPP
jgi:biopolymer transport protein ExbD/biopolymer transport protein TolR